jgi:hypothetical protein
LDTKAAAADQHLTDLLDFIEARAAEDHAYTCRLCHNDASLADVGTMARAWTMPVRDHGVTPRRFAILKQIASLHRDHPDYSPAWDRRHTEP